MNEEEFVGKYGPLENELCTLLLLSQELMEKARNREFKSDIDAFNWIDKKRKEAGYPYNDADRARMIHIAEQADAARRLGGSN